MSLPLLSANEIENVYQQLKHSLSDVSKTTLQLFFNYFERQWIRKVAPAAFSCFMLPRRTNNDCESYNRTLNQRFNGRSNIWNFTSEYHSSI